MTLEPLISSTLAIQIHVATVVPAFVIGTWLIFFSHKGAPWHRKLGFIYLALMTITSISALFIHEITGMPTLFGFGPIHILVPVTLFGVMGALRGAWTHNIALHKRAMLSVYIGAILIAGTFALMPGRIMHQAIFG